jgi:hypothetical protein
MTFQQKAEYGDAYLWSQLLIGMWSGQFEQKNMRHYLKITKANSTGGVTQVCKITADSFYHIRALLKVQSMFSGTETAVLKNWVWTEWK